MPIILFKEKTARAFFARHLALALLGALGCQPEEQAARDAAWVADTAWVADARWAGDLGQLEDGAPRVDGGLRLSYEGRYTSEAGDHVTLLLSSTAPTPLDVALYLDRPLDARLEPPHARLTPATPTARVLMIGQDNSALDGDRQITIDARGGGYTARALINHRDDEVALRPRAGRDPHAGRWVEQLSEGRGVWILAPDDTQDGAPWLIAHEAGVGYACWRLASGARVPLTGPAAVEGRREGEALIYREGEALYRVDTRSLARTRLGVAERLWAVGPGVALISHEGALAWLDEAGVAPLEAPRAEGLRGCVAGRGRVACWGEAGVYEGALGDALTGPRLSAEAAGEPALRAAGAWWGLAHGEIVDLEGQAVMTATPQRHLSPLGGAALLGSGPGALDPTAAGIYLIDLEAATARRVLRPAGGLRGPERGARCACCGARVCGEAGCQDPEGCAEDADCPAPRRCLEGACRALLDDAEIARPHRVGAGIAWSSYGDVNGEGCDRHLYWAPLSPTERAASGLGAAPARRASVSPSGAWRVALDGGGVEALPPLGGAWLGALDVDGDGRPDRAALSPEEGGWRVEVDLAYGGWGRVDLSVWIEGEARPLLGDVDGDGRAEVARRVEGRWIFEAPLAAARATLLILEGAPPDPTALGDVDGDGRADLITWARGEGGWRWSWAPVAAGDYAARGAWIGGPLSAQPLLGDVDGDGRVDATWIEVTSAGGRWWVSDTREVGGVFALGAGPWRAIEGAWGDAKATPLWWPYAE